MQCAMDGEPFYCFFRRVLKHRALFRMKLTVSFSLLGITALI